MSRADLRQRIKDGTLIIDGGMGTQLIAQGVDPGKCGDYLNIESPDIVKTVNQAYSRAGSQATITNTFGANRLTLARHGLAEQARQISKAGAEIARDAVGEDNYVLGDIGPCGDFLEPLGTLKPDQLKDAFAEQAEGLAKGGADAIIIETMTALDEIAVAVEAVKSVCDLPVFTSLAFDTAGDDFRTMMGVDVEAAVNKLAPLGIDAIGFNCGTVSLEKYIRLAEKYVKTVKDIAPDLKVLAEPNAGLPEMVNNEPTYTVGPEEFADAVMAIHAAGVTILGGCCGTTPDHIAAIAKKLKS